MENNFNFGAKVKKRRKELGLTQSAVAAEFMTRNMLSLIEAGKASPSLETASYLSKKLDIPMAYLFSTDTSPFIYEKQSKITYIKDLFARKNYSYCMSLIEQLSDTDDELSYIHALCAFNLGRAMLFHGQLNSALKLFDTAVLSADKTLYDTDEIRALSLLYSAVAENIQSPLLEFDQDIYEEIRHRHYDVEFYKYITLDYGYEFKNKLFGKHFDAKRLIKKYNYVDAITILLELEEYKNQEYNACVLFGVYCDLELCYKQLGDFESAYRYSTKRISLINAFNS